MTPQEDVRRLRQEVMKLRVENSLLQKQLDHAYAQAAMILQAACLYRNAHAAVKAILPQGSLSSLQPVDVKNAAKQLIVNRLIQAQLLLFAAIDLVQNEQGRDLVDGHYRPPTTHQ